MSVAVVSINLVCKLFTISMIGFEDEVFTFGLLGLLSAFWLGLVIITPINKTELNLKTAQMYLSCMSFCRS